jgi:hypothetical protein
VTQPPGFAHKVGFVWSVADLLRGDFKAHEYGQVILPLVVLRRLECALAPTKDKVIEGRGAGRQPRPRRGAQGGRETPVLERQPARPQQDPRRPGTAAASLRTYLGAEETTRKPPWPSCSAISVPRSSRRRARGYQTEE